MCYGDNCNKWHGGRLNRLLLYGIIIIIVRDVYFCLVCVKPYGWSRPGEGWVQCIQYHGWSHYKCVLDRKSFIFAIIASQNEYFFCCLNCPRYMVQSSPVRGQLRHYDKVYIFLNNLPKYNYWQTEKNITGNLNECALFGLFHNFKNFR